MCEVGPPGAPLRIHAPALPAPHGVATPREPPLGRDAWVRVRLSAPPLTVHVGRRRVLKRSSAAASRHGPNPPPRWRARDRPRQRENPARLGGIGASQTRPTRANWPMSRPANDLADMATVSRARRSGRSEMAGRRRARAIAQRLGTALREARWQSGFSQAEVAKRSGVSQPRISNLERGHGAGATLETWAVAAAAAGEQLVGYLERAPGSDRPRDIEHIRRQNAIVLLARSGGWVAMPELALDRGAVRSRSIDVALLRRQRREAAVVEIWDWFDDVGAGFRSLDGKVGALAQRLSAQAPDGPWRVAALYVVRETRRNRSLVRELAAIFDARFPGAGGEWLEALTTPSVAMPTESAYVWSSSTGGLRAPRPRLPAPPPTGR
jgi:transcriptional regulator with XRE-family HTH domain